MAWLRHLDINDLRNIRHVSVELHPGLNVFHGRNAQGKTSLLEAVGFIARGRSFRTEDSPSLIRRGAEALRARGEVAREHRSSSLEVELQGRTRSFRVDGRDVMPRDYHGRLEVVVYSTDRLRVVRGSMRDRRLFIDRSAGALWPSYRAEVRAFERVLRQRNVALQDKRPDLPVWTERFVEIGARLRQRRASYASRLSEALRDGFRPDDEEYAVEVRPRVPQAEADARQALADELARLGPGERASGRSLAGPHRDGIHLLLNGRDAAQEASSGQSRSLLLALVLASLQIHRQETGHAAVALLDDLDSELDQDRTRALCATVLGQSQALVTSAHPGWAQSLRDQGRLFHVSGGEVRCA